MPLSGDPDPKMPTFLKIWFVFCGVAAVASLAVIGWLVVALIAWLGRH